MHDHQGLSTKNKILKALSQEDLARIAPKLEAVDLPHAFVLYKPEEIIEHVYFPINAMISVVTYNEDGQGTETAVIGNEGAAGLDVILGADTAANEFITQLPNGGVRMKTADVREEFGRAGAFQGLLLQFTRRLIVQISQTALCNRIHTTEKRLARWLLMCHDRSPSDTLKLTQEFMSVMLGANRTTVTLTAIELQNAGFISYSRGSLKVLDRPGLEAFTCSCYETIRKAYSDFMPSK